MTDFAGFQFDAFRGDLKPAIGQVLVSAGPPKVVNSARAKPIESIFESETACASPAAALALAAQYRSVVGYVTVFKGAAVFIANFHHIPSPEKGTGNAIVHGEWSLYAAPDWMPDA